MAGFAAAATAVVAAGFVVSVSSMAMVSGQQAPPLSRDAKLAPPATASASIAGAVTAGDSGRPLRRVRISLEDDRGTAKAFAVTDEQGRFTLTPLAAGSYILKAARAGFLEVIYGQSKRGSGRAGTPIKLADGQRLEKLALALPRGSVITGVITDEVGDPVSNVAVRAFRSVMRSGERAWQSPATIASSDDRGQYRAFGLVPGEYLLCATPRDDLALAAAQAEALRRRMDEIKAAAARPGASPETQMMVERMNAAVLPEPPKDAYVAVCAPGVTRVGAAVPVTVDVGEDRDGVNIQLPLVPIARVSGSVSWSGGKLPVGNTADDTYVSLRDAQAIPGLASYGMHVPASGEFAIVNVPAGTYTLAATATVKPWNLWSTTEITVTGDPVTGLALDLQRGMSVSGRVVSDGAAGIDIAKMRITASFLSVIGNFAADVAPIVVSPDANGNFTLEGVLPGRYRITAYPGSPGAGNVRSAVFNGRDSLDFGVEVRPGEPLSGGVITIVPRLAEITGQLQHDANQPATGFTVIVFPADQQFWTPQARRIQAVRPATDGRFSFRNLPGGEYRLVAVTDVEPGQWFDPAFLKELAVAAIPVTLAEGERKDQTLRVVKR